MESQRIEPKAGLYQLVCAVLLAFACTPAFAQLAERIFVDGFQIGLNDTGQDWCANAFDGNLTCPQSGFPRQDGDFGRDALARAGQLSKIGGGEAGFDFTKISNSGQPLPAAAALGTGANNWACTRDNVTGLLWEVKLFDAASLRDQTHRYTWYSTDSSINGGNPGSVGTASTCSSTLSLCNIQAYVAAVNAQGLCGFNDWRMPDQGQLLGIANHRRSNPAIDPAYFRNTLSNWYWTGRNFAGIASDAWGVSFINGSLRNNTKANTYHVRLVRGGQ